MTENDFVTPIMPTGSGVADLEIAREQDALAEGSGLVGADETNAAAEQIIPPEQAPMDGAAGGPQAQRPDAPFEDPETNDTATGDLTVQGGE